MEKYKEKEVVEIEEVLIGVECDICGKVIRTEEEIEKRLKVDDFYYHVTTGHRDWGSDSGDSRETFDLCSKECLEKHIEDYIEKKSYTIHYSFERTTV